MQAVSLKKVDPHFVLAFRQIDQFCVQAFSSLLFFFCIVCETLFVVTKKLVQIITQYVAKKQFS